ncbi:MAG: hypothetical protein PHY61_08095 [Candidatus Cloacimonetes bacterium]|nr:hypothetical protein [Candidatus Cloacimonadota bacterium]
MEKQTLTFADQEIANRLASRKHFLKDVDQLIDWKRINKLISKVEIRRTSVVLPALFVFLRSKREQGFTHPYGCVLPHGRGFLSSNRIC